MFSCQGAPAPVTDSRTMPDFARTEAFADYLLRTFWALLVLFVSLLLARGLRAVTMRGLQRARAHSNAIVLLGNLAQIAVLIVGALVILAIYTGPNFAAILTSFSIIGLVVGLSLQDILKNFIAGIWILVERPFRIGDTVQVGEHAGVVEEIAFRTTLLRTVDGRQVVIPNNTLMTGTVVNHSAYPMRSASFALTLPGDRLPPDPAAEIRQALATVRAIAAEPAPSVELRSFTGGRARFLVTFWSTAPLATRPAAMSAVRGALPDAEVREA